MMRAMFKHAETCNWIPENPLNGIQLKAKSVRKIDPLTEEEEDRLLKALKDRERDLRTSGEAMFDNGEFADFLRPVVLVAMHTGMRFGEIASLTWENVSIGRDSDSRPQVWLPDTKNNEPHQIPLNVFVVSVLRKWRNQCAIIDTSALVFKDHRGQKLTSIRRFWHPVFRQAVLPEGYRFHDLRHHFASRLVMSGVPLFAVQSLLNHGSPMMTQRYAKFAPEWMDQTVGKLSEKSKWTL
jgi:integrase